MRISLAAGILWSLVSPLSAQTDEPSLARRLSEAATHDLGENQHLAPLLEKGATVEEWERQAPALRQQWTDLLGAPSFGDDYDKTLEIVETFEQPGFRGTLFRQPTGPGTKQLVLLMEPKISASSPRPGAVVPFYHPDAMAGFDLAKHTPITDKRVTQFGRQLVEQGYVVVCTEAFPYNLVPEAAPTEGLEIWRVAAEMLAEAHPNWTGMGKLVHDTRRAVDLLLEQPDIDPGRVVAIGHSLGGKMAFYTACLDPRITATIASDFGIGWDFTNWSDPWYFGNRIHADGFSLAHHQLLALHAPRPFLLIAGQYDKPESGQYLNAARPVYALYDRHEALGMLDHASGHQPTEEAMRTAYQWLDENFGSNTPPTTP